jgi:hypothetical protein
LLFSFPPQPENRRSAKAVQAETSGLTNREP